MADGDLLEGPFSIEFNGWSAGCGPARLASLDGVESLPDQRIGNVERGRSHGLVLGPQFSDGRIITAQVNLVGDTETVRQQVTALTAATSPLAQEVPLLWELPAMAPRRALARVRARRLPIDRDYSLNVGRAVIQWLATDPRIYSNTEQSGSTGVGAVTGGLALPHGFPHGFGLAEAGTIAASNAGNQPAPWRGTLHGPLTSPRISLVGTDGDIELAGFVLADGDTLELDSRDRTVLLNGTASRSGSLTSRAWFDLPVGASAVQLTAGAGTGTLDLEWRDTWL